MSVMKTCVCPHCKSEMEVEEKYNGYETACTVCGQDFIIQFHDDIPVENVEDNKTEMSDSNDKKKKRKHYIWGELYIVLSYIIAIIIIIICLITSAFQFSGLYFMKEDNKRNINKEAVLLQDQQAALVTSYNRIVQTLCSNNNRNVKTPLAGSENQFTVNAIFSNDLSGKESVRNSLNVLQSYRKNIHSLSGKYSLYFLKKLQFAEKNRYRPEDLNKLNDESGSIQVHSGQQFDFYNDNKSSTLDELEKVLDKTKGMSCFSYNEKIILNSFKPDLDFISLMLINNNKAVHTAGITGNLGEYRVNERHTERRGKDMKMVKIHSLILSLTQCMNDEVQPNWKIMHQINALEKNLTVHSDQIQKYEDNEKRELQRLVIKAFLLILGGCFASFMLLVFADYLRAHFDSAASLLKICEKDL